MTIQQAKADRLNHFSLLLRAYIRDSEAFLEKYEGAEIIESITADVRVTLAADRELAEEFARRVREMGAEL